mgnify:CR=1 FL=1
MKIKTLTGYLCALCILTATAVAAQGGKGVINTLDLDKDRISIGYRELEVDSDVRVMTASGAPRTTDHLHDRQHVSYTLDKWGRVVEIRIYDPSRLVEQGFLGADEVD